MSTIESWLREGTAHRTPVQRTPIIHLLVDGPNGLSMWCSGGKGREDNPHGNRLCHTCRQLATDAVSEGMLSPESAGRWAS